MIRHTGGFLGEIRDPLPEQTNSERRRPA